MCKYIPLFYVDVIPYVDVNPHAKLDAGLAKRVLGPLLLTWFNFNPSMDK